ncbi:spore coat associated protein SpaC [Bacillus carboniphilus]|uniref:Spore coat associated protein SpaC n=1 Tax=Bacillus carboniphilus TaxID=86663 RepID=A0ABN0W7Z2_9BACI
MLSLGLLSLQPETQPFFSQLAYRAADYGIQCYRFSPLQIHPDTDLIEGERYDLDLQEWVNETFSIPKYLYDRCYYGDDRKSFESKSIIRWLKSRDDLTFLGYGLPNKWMLYEKLSTFDSLSPYLPDTEKAKNVKHIIQVLSRYKTIVLKPVNGAHGYGIYIITLHPKEVTIQTQKKNQIITQTFSLDGAWTNWLSQLIEKKDFLIQPYLSLKNQATQPFDIRIFLQKDERGNWVERGRGVRVGISGGVISNLSGGANVTSYEEWLKDLPKLKRDFIHQEIQSIVKQLPEILEDSFFPLFEVGLDIGIAQDFSVWLLDVNSKPGRSVILSLFPEMEEVLVNAPLRFTRYLYQISKPGRVKK